MGMFTTIIHEGTRYQIKHGWDQCDEHQVGDTIEWEPDERYPGEHIDGAHDGMAEDGSLPLWFIIKDCKIVGVESLADNSREAVLDKYGVAAPPRALWSDAAWAAKAAREAEAKAEMEQHVALMAAAPDLLAALMGTADALALSCEEGREHPLVKAADKAIRKARKKMK
jgi:hypothetical protein